jgi:hypothetical protein
MAEKTREFKLRPGVGKHEVAIRNDKGEITERRMIGPNEKEKTARLTQREYEAFQDKFEPVEGDDNDWKSPVLTATQPQADGRDTSAPSSDAAKEAIEQNEKGADGKKTGAGASENSSNKATVPGPGASSSSPTKDNTGANIQSGGGGSNPTVTKTT